jgi:hypothetical protein
MDNTSTLVWPKRREIESTSSPLRPPCREHCNCGWLYLPCGNARSPSVCQHCWTSHNLPKPPSPSRQHQNTVYLTGITLLVGHATMPYFYGNTAHKNGYCTFSFKSTGGVMHDPFYLFDISAAAKFFHDTFKILAFEPKISSFLHFLGSLGTCVTTWRFDRGLSYAWPRPNFMIDRGVYDAWLPIKGFVSVCLQLEYYWWHGLTSGMQQYKPQPLTKIHILVPPGCTSLDVPTSIHAF